MAALLQFSYLQLLDLLTTLAFLVHGVNEGNPVVRLAMDLAPSPLVGLVAVKLAALAMGLYCWRSGRNRILRGMNVLFAVAVAWNIVTMILGPVQAA